MTPAPEENYIPLDELDPRTLLPFECVIEASDQPVERLPNAFIGTDQPSYGGDKLYY